MSRYAYVGEVLAGGKLSIDPSISRKLIRGQKVKVTLEPVAESPERRAKKGLDAATLRVLENIRNAPRLGSMRGDLSREDASPCPVEPSHAGFPEPAKGEKIPTR
jgi:hypothetical protein